MSVDLPNVKHGAVLVGSKQTEIQERPLPKPGPGEAVIKVDYCGMCGSDTHGWEAGGAVFPLGTLMGHEPVGTVAEIGPGVSRYKTGDRVAINGFKPCGMCLPCRRGMYNICVNNMTHTIGNSDQLDGAFADYIWLPDADLMAVKVPDHLSQELTRTAYVEAFQLTLGILIAMVLLAMFIASFIPRIDTTSLTRVGGH